MAPPKIPKKPSKIEKPIIEKPISKSKKKSRKSYGSFSMFIYRVLRHVMEDNMGITKQSMLVMNNFVFDFLEKFAAESSRLVMRGKRNTMSSHDVKSSIKLVIPGELSKHANIEGFKALTQYHNAVQREK